MADKTKLGIGIFIALALMSGGIYYIETSEDYKPYYCEGTDNVGLCWKLSNPNVNNLSTRCFWNMSAATLYKNCNSGWKPLEGFLTPPENIYNESNESILIPTISLPFSLEGLKFEKIYCDDLQCYTKVFREGTINRDYVTANTGNIIEIKESLKTQISNDLDNIYQIRVKIINETEEKRIDIYDINEDLIVNKTRFTIEDIEIIEDVQGI